MVTQILLSLLRPWRLQTREWGLSPGIIMGIKQWNYLILLWQRPLSYRNQSIDLLRKSMDWFLYDIGLRHERVKSETWSWYSKALAFDSMRHFCIEILLNATKGIHWGCFLYNHAVFNQGWYKFSENGQFGDIRMHAWETSCENTFFLKLQFLAPSVTLKKWCIFEWKKL